MRPIISESPYITNTTKIQCKCTVKEWLEIIGMFCDADLESARDALGVTYSSVFSTKLCREKGR